MSAARFVRDAFNTFRVLILLLNLTHALTKTQQDLVSVNTVLLFHLVADCEQQTKLSAKDFGDRKIIIVEDLIT